jgi:hypothetical protein
MLRLYVKRETAQNKCYNKVPKLLLSEIKVVFSLIRPGNRLRSGHFLKTCRVIWEIAHSVGKIAKLRGPPKASDTKSLVERL